MFEDVADVCYNMLDHLEQYKQYLDSMKLIHVPVHMKSSASASSIMQPATDPATMQSATAIQSECAMKIVINFMLVSEFNFLHCFQLKEIFVLACQKMNDTYLVKKSIYFR